MTRKKRITVTKETYNIIKNMHELGNNSINYIVQATGLCRKTVSSQIKKIEQGTNNVSPYKKLSATVALKKDTLNEVEISILHDMTRNNSNTQVEMIAAVKEKYDQTISASTMYRVFKKIGLKRKRITLVPEERNTEDKLLVRMDYASDVLRFSNDIMIFLDETGFNEHTKRYYGYAAPNEPAIITAPANKGHNKSVMVVIFSDGIVGYKLSNRPFNKESFKNFISEILVPYFSNHPNKILIMDNASFHKSNEIKQFLTDNRINFKYLVPYSLQLNPIEEFFSMLKERVKNIRHNSEILLTDAIERTLNGENNYSEHIGGFYRHMREWLAKARRKEHFL